MKQHIPYALATLVLGLIWAFVVIDSRSPTVNEPTPSGLEQRVQRLEERLDALQEVTHNLVGNRSGK